MSHYDESILTAEEYEKEYEEMENITFNNLKGKVVCTLPSLEGYVEVGVGKDAQEAKEDLLEHIVGFIDVLNDARIRVMYDKVELEYTTIGE